VVSVPGRWRKANLSVLLVSAALFVVTEPAAAVLHQKASTTASSPSAALTLASQTSWVSPTAPWFSLSLVVANDTGPLSDLHVEVTFYSRTNDAFQLERSISATPDKSYSVLTHYNVPVTATTTGRVAYTCATVLPEGATAPTTGATNTVACPAGAPTVALDCRPGNGTCGDVYPVSVALFRQGTGAPLERFTTLLTYQEPAVTSAIGAGGALRISLIMPVAVHLSPTLAAPAQRALAREEHLVGAVSAHRDVAVTLAANPSTVSNLLTNGNRKARHAVRRLQTLTTGPGDDELLTQSYVPIDVSALAGAGLTGEIDAQLVRGTALLRSGGLHPASGTWVDTASDFSSADSADLRSGLSETHADRVVLDDTDLAPTARTLPLTFAQTFSLRLGHGAHVAAAVANSQVDSLFTAHPADPVLEANQLVATLAFIHFENAFALDARGIVIEPPASWVPTVSFVSTLFDELAGNPSLSAVTLNQLFSQVPEGGNQEPATRHLIAGVSAEAETIAPSTSRQLSAARSRLTSLREAVPGHPPVLNELSDELLATENQDFNSAQRKAALTTFARHFGSVLGLISLAAQNAITFTSPTAAIPVSVLSSAPFPVKVVLSLDSDKFNFPHGSSRTLVLDRPTTAVRIQAHSETSGDRLPVGVTVTTPDGQLIIARAELTVHATSISVVGIALTVLAALVLVVWWSRSWRKRSTRHNRGTI
jgi:hypothetical protein